MLVFSDSAVFDKVSTAIRNYGGYALTGHKIVPNIVSLSHYLEQLFSCILTVIYVNACDNASEKAMHYK